MRYYSFVIFEVIFSTNSKSFPLNYTRVVMNFESLVIIAIGGQKQIVVRQLMDVGLLNAMQYCIKYHDRKRMILQ